MSIQPPGRDAGHDAGQDETPAIRLSHPLDRDPATWGGEPADDDGVFDSLTEMFLGGDDSVDDSVDFEGPIAEAKKLPVEALVLGHLPVMASAWVSQYARHAARGDGAPVALVKSRSGRVTIELHGDADVSHAAAEDVGEALCLAAAHAGRWLLRVDELDEAALGAPGVPIDRLTVLSSTEKTAVVGCYHALKSFGLGEDAPAVRVAVLDAGDGRAEVAVDKLRRAAEAFLSRPLEGELFEGRIGRGKSVTLFDGPTEMGLEALLAAIPRESVATEEVAQVEPEPIAAPTPVMVEARPVEVSEGIGEGVMDPPYAESFAAEAVEEPAKKRASLLSDRLDDVTGLPARCPFAEHVELAADGTGTLQLLVECGADAVSSSIETIEAVRAWAAEHRALLALACPQLTTEGSTAHLFTDDPRRVRRLLDGSIRMHLLARAEQAVRDGWVCADLN